jgi:hypothetical protein
MVARIYVKQLLKVKNRPNRENWESVKTQYVHPATVIAVVLCAKEFSSFNQDPILRLRNLQQQRQRCSRRECFFKVEENIFVFETH